MKSCTSRIGGTEPQAMRVGSSPMGVAILTATSCSSPMPGWTFSPLKNEILLVHQSVAWPRSTAPRGRNRPFMAILLGVWRWRRSLGRIRFVDERSDDVVFSAACRAATGSLGGRSEARSSAFGCRFECLLVHHRLVEGARSSRIRCAPHRPHSQALVMLRC